MLARHLVVESLKLRRSLALGLCLAAPALVVALQALVLLNRATGTTAQGFAVQSSMLWGIGMLPLAVTALSVLLAQIEHGPDGWRHLLALPGARPSLFLAKAIVMLLLVAAMHAVLFVLVIAAGEGWTGCCRACSAVGGTSPPSPLASPASAWRARCSRCSSSG